MTARTRMLPKRLMAASLLVVALAGCRSHGELVVDESVGVTAVRGACPAVGIPDYTGDVTLFTTAGATLAQRTPVRWM